jgi:hypothetical protein
MLQDDDYKIRNTIDKLSNLTLSPSVGSKFTSWWQGLSTAFTTTARRTALQINTVIDKAFTPEPSPEPVAAPVQKTMDEKPYSVASPRLERQESFIVEPPTCDCICDVPSAECEAPSAEYLATDADATTATSTAVETHGTDSAIGAESGHQAKTFDSEVGEAEKKEV